MNKIFFLLIILLLSSCSVVVNTPSSRFISPEAKGKLGAHDISLGVSGSTEVVLVTSGVTPGQQIKNPLKLDRSYTGLAGGNMGILEKLDLYITAPLESTPMLGFKYQILGDAENKAKKGNHSLAITGAFGQVTKTVQELELFNIQTDEIKNTNRQRDTSLIYGYRMRDHNLFYTGISYSEVNLDGYVVQGPNVGSNYDYDTEILGAHLGFMNHGDSYFVKVEASVQQTQWTNTGKQAFGFIGAQFGLRWGNE